MIEQEAITKLGPILSSREIEVVLKRLNNRHITQTESNYLSRSIRPKLRSAEFASSTHLLSLLIYRRKRYEREDRVLKKKIIEAIGDYMDQVRAIILFGSYVRNKHSNYKDIDVMVVFKKRLWKNSAEKYKLKDSLEKAGSLNIEVHLLNYQDLIQVLPYSPLLQFQLSDHKLVYGSINLQSAIHINKLYLYGILLGTEFVKEYGGSLESKYIYNAIRTCLSIEFFLHKRIDNYSLTALIYQNIGKTTAESLCNNTATKSQRKIGMIYLKYLYNKLEEHLK